ncbi:DEAD/DEAH box helicase [Corynebacterium glutamicum]|uniref:DEAD/DEAH box helicase n=1 Tax=Corynebacterium glutamicum TaxID=1718 RepID=UPI0009454711|nr:DEAD/DEAH box helicase family protein [Corynebacterium glutamicum]OKX88602.1 restriction endonuclease [Corynebacterium glutamicum]QDX75795.1 restriction endonuclease [Corynebacterium glutamicum]QDX78567.1 restriction endonuclease [Corynebacterium glutamicum]TWS31934.1 restriction endonuclease [Corynebacterium glutamicum]TWS32885.1 restriction endonuclease [Corynebacterium glutamicum]
MALHVTYDENLIEELSSRFNLRNPNREALTTLVQRLNAGEYTPLGQLMLDLATGVGKTFVMAAFIEYLNRQGHRNVMVVTPNTVVQDKTVRDFSHGSERYIDGFHTPPILVTPNSAQGFSIAESTQSVFATGDASMLYVFNVQQLFPPKDSGKSQATGQEAQRRKTWRWQEEYGSLMDHLRSLDDLVVIVDEAHLFGSSAKVYRSALEELLPQATVGLTASPDKKDEIVYRYPLWRAIKDGYVKQPVLVYRNSGYDSEDRQLQDAMSLLTLKEKAYAGWRAAHSDAKPTKPLLFVVCSDVAHATETAARLRTATFTGSDVAVLQVDNEHDDAATQSFLRYLDAEHSPVRVIVSVNKLREGWDTKRIAVMCTLRAMGSDVLTQQVMGRGLRLPFGELTGVEPIDELDIISHKSFVSLLKSENVLREFGIDSDDRVDPEQVLAKPGTKHEPNVGPDTGSPTAGTPQPAATAHGGSVPAAEGITGSEARSAADVLGSKGLDDDEDIAGDEDVFQQVTVSMNPPFAGTTFLFPATTMEKTIAPFELADISTDAIVAAAKRTKNTAEYLERTRIAAATGKSGEGAITAQATDRVAVDSLRQSESEVRTELIRRVLTTGVVSNDPENRNQLTQRIVPTFMDHTGIDAWTEKAKFSAAEELRALVVAEMKQTASEAKTKTTIVPVELPIDDSFTLDFGKKILERLTVTPTSTKASTGFKEREYYGPWTKGLFEAAAFDSFSGEYRLAEILNFDPDVVWWKRLYPHEGAVVAYTPQNDYHPDFVVLAADGTHWIIEGKSQRGRDDQVVQRKKDAAEKAIRLLAGKPDYVNQAWGYLIAFEDDIATADSLADLLATGATERTR